MRGKGGDRGASATCPCRGMVWGLCERRQLSFVKHREDGRIPTFGSQHMGCCGEIIRTVPWFEIKILLPDLQHHLSAEDINEFLSLMHGDDLIGIFLQLHDQGFHVATLDFRRKGFVGVKLFLTFLGGGPGDDLLLCLPSDGSVPGVRR